MREAIGSSLLLNLVIIFAGIVILFFVGIMAYSKAYRVKNRIISTIEKYESYDASMLDELNNDLQKIGYNSTSSKKCSEGNLNTTTYDYCIYLKKSNERDIGSGKTPYYYEVVTYVHFDFPIIGDYITFPVKGETRMLGYDYSY